MKKTILWAVCIAVVSSSSSFARVVLDETFDKTKDLLLLQYDSWPDSDDIHSQAAAGCMLRHSDWSDVNYYAVAGAYGVQVPGPTEDGYFIDSTSLFNLAFGPENVGWTDAHNHRTGSINRIRNRAVATLNAGGKVWVAEAGQSNITADWIAAVLAAGVDPTVVKNNVWVIHHSPWNQTLMTDPDDFDYVSANAYMYKRIGDGNADTLDNANRVGTPGFVADETTHMNSALSSPNLEARALWADTNAVLNAHYAANTDITNGNPHISIGGVDFSDTVVIWAILRDDNVETVADFWAKYVVNTTNTGSGADLDITIQANMYNGESHENNDTIIRDAGTKIATIRNNSWVRYDDFDFGTSGAVSVDVSASSAQAGGTIQFRLGSPTGTLISSVDVTGTGGWNTFSTFSNTLSTNATGTHDLYLTFIGNGSGVLMHVRDFFFVSGAAPGSDLGISYYAESFNDESHPGNDTIIVRQGTNVAKIKNGSWINFLDYNFGSGASSIEVSAAANGSGGNIEFRLGSPTGTLIGTVAVSTTGGWNSFATFSTNQVTSVPGVDDLYLVFTGGSGGVTMKLGTLQID